MPILSQNGPDQALLRGAAAQNAHSAIALTLILCFAPAIASTQTAPQPSTDAQRNERIAQQLQELRSMKQDLLQNMLNMQRQMSAFDARIDALEVELRSTPAKEQLAPPSAVATADSAMPSPPVTAPSPSPVTGEFKEPAELVSESKAGHFEPGKGIILARGSEGEVSFGVFTYVRYLNQLGLKSTYTDAFGRTTKLDLRNDLELNREQINFRGWLFSQRFNYAFWVWTQNTSQGDPAQVVVGGNMTYTFSDWLTLRAGIFSIPTTRSTSLTFPNWLKIDHRTMADEFFRGSYTTAIQAEGRIVSRLVYKVALADNLSQLGVNALQLDNGLNTVASALWWMPTTGEFGTGYGFGDYEHHESLATLFGVHYSRSREDRQAQPNIDEFENTQLRLSDGTLIFSPDPFNTGGQINQATYQMLDLEAGLKLRGSSLEGEYYFRRLGDFNVTGTIPVTSVFDHGFQVQASTMFAPKSLQGYVAGSKIFGEYGSPWDLGIGTTWFPSKRKQARINFQALYNKRSPVGGAALPYLVGADGWIFTVDAGVWF